MDIDKFSYSANLAAELAELKLQLNDKLRCLLNRLAADVKDEASEAKEVVNQLAKELVDDNGKPFEGFEDLAYFVRDNKEILAASIASERWYSSAEYAEQAQQYDEAVFGDGYSE